MICSTLFVYNSKKSNFIKNSQDCVIVLNNFDQEKKDSVIEKLRNLTFQNVLIEQKEGVTYVRIKCPPERAVFFRRLLSEN
jgi:hypothetical protein